MTIQLENPGYSYSSATGDGVTKAILFAFVGEAPGYLSNKDISVWVRQSDVELPDYGVYFQLDEELAFPSLNVVETITAIEAPLDELSNIWIRRIQDKTSTYADVNSDNIFRKEVINNSFINQLYIQHEVLDGFTDNEQQRNNLNMGGFRITDMAPGFELRDAINVEQSADLIDEMEDILEDAELARDETFEARDETVELRDNAFNHASAGEDVPVNDGTNPAGFSAFHHATKAEDSAQRATDAANTSSIAIGEIKWFFTDHNNPTEKIGLILPQGQLLDKIGDYNALWLSIEAGLQPVVSEAQWQAGQRGAYVDFDANQFRIPKLDGEFIRTPGTKDPDFPGRPVGGIQDEEVGPFSEAVGMNAVGAHRHTGSSLTWAGTFSGNPLPFHSHAMEVRKPVNNQVTNLASEVDTQGSNLSGYVLASSIRTIGISAGTPAGGVSGSIGGNTGFDGGHAHSASVSRNQGETRPVNMYLQPYVSYSGVTSGVGLTFRGIWDASLNVITGDALNLAIVKGQAPAVEISSSPDGQGYICSVGGEFDLIDGLETFTRGDRILWVGEEFTGEWIHFSASTVASVNGQIGVVVIHGENADISQNDPTSIKEYIDSAVLSGQGYVDIEIQNLKEWSEDQFAILEGDIDGLAGELNSLDSEVTALELRVQALEDSPGGGGGDGVWGSIIGLLSDQTDLQLELDAIYSELGETASQADLDALILRVTAVEQTLTDKADITYVNIQDDATLTSANDYADEGDGQVLILAGQDATSKDAVVLQNANTYSDQQDVIVLESAISHSDLADDALLLVANAHADDGDTDTLNSAESYADNKDALSLVLAKDYADVGDQALQQQIDNIAGGVSPQGPATVAELNAIVTPVIGNMYRMSDAGVLTGGVNVVINDEVIWDSTLIWINLGQAITLVAWGTVSGTLSDQADLVQEFALKANTVYVDSSNDAQDVVIGTKASQVYVDAQNASQDAVTADKADTSYVDTQNDAQDLITASKASTAYVDNANDLQDTEIGLKADQTYVDSEFIKPDTLVARWPVDAWIRDANNTQRKMFNANGSTIERSGNAVGDGDIFTWRDANNTTVMTLNSSGNLSVANSFTQNDAPINSNHLCNKEFVDAENDAQDIITDLIDSRVTALENAPPSEGGGTSIYINVHDFGVIADGDYHAGNEQAMQDAIDYAQSINQYVPNVGNTGSTQLNQVRLYGEGVLRCDFKIDLDQCSCDFMNMLIVIDDTAFPAGDWVIGAGKENFQSYWAHKQDINLNLHNANGRDDNQDNVLNVIAFRLRGADCAQGTVFIKASYLGHVAQNDGAENWRWTIHFRRCGIVLSEISVVDSGDSNHYLLVGKHPCVLHHMSRHDGSNVPGGLQVGGSMEFQVENCTNYSQWPSWMKNDTYNKGIIQNRGAKSYTYSGYLRGVDNEICPTIFVETNGPNGTPAGDVYFDNLQVIQAREDYILYVRSAKGIHGTINGHTVRGDDGGNLLARVPSPIFLGRVESCTAQFNLGQMTFEYALQMGEQGGGQNLRPTFCTPTVSFTPLSGSQLGGYVLFANARDCSVYIKGLLPYNGVNFGSEAQRCRVLGGRGDLPVADSGVTSEVYDEVFARQYPGPIIPPEPPVGSNLYYVMSGAQSITMPDIPHVPGDDFTFEANVRRDNIGEDTALAGNTQGDSYIRIYADGRFTIRIGTATVQGLLGDYPDDGEPHVVRMEIRNGNQLERFIDDVSLREPQAFTQAVAPIAWNQIGVRNTSGNWEGVLSDVMFDTTSGINTYRVDDGWGENPVIEDSTGGNDGTAVGFTEAGWKEQ